jgi:peptidoglycan/xylan/chitin deacetylase (PgdA/CDA1 family)
MSRHIVCLTFDHDHLSGFIARGQTTPTAISRGEYDVVVIPRLVSLLERYGIKATFFTPGHTIDSTPQAVTPYVEAGHELAHYPHFEYMRLPNGSVMPGLMNATNVLENFVDDFIYMTRVQPDFGILTYTFHPHVIGRGHRMMMLERLIQKLMEGGAVFMTMEAAMQEWLARQNKAGKIAAE